ncbi:hypothetical protein Desaci_1964 [Desulfosporosinus acidiphilus SJ4]|uniref:Uncharacterized protein n=1 Tax=Desulfosporosinus acidiphilus (strain DSM 22704 / JCM 16185 / SJ4) TaxID=646529 RepID=I4D567_DESAJ|nr:hypothetical protein [Desulfosporosinus acidiphilus]AFM40941.1 hypothetical protein Desaci_1964 [Desulfosporosinus acidiphilus SJ4]
MKRVLRWLGLIAAIIVISVLSVKIVEYNSLVSRNTRNLERILSQNTYSEKGNVKNLITFDYDKMYVFLPYLPRDEMEKQIGFKYPKLIQALNEGINNILFVKDDKPVAYLFGYPSDTGYYINIPSGEYTKAQIEATTYQSKTREVGNSYGTPKKYVNYLLTD